MKAIAASLLILSTALAVHFADGAPTPDRPAGVDAGHWIPVAIVTTDRQPLLLMPPAEGYFMVHTGDAWQRLVIQDPLKGPGTSG